MTKKVKRLLAEGVESKGNQVERPKQPEGYVQSARSKKLAKVLSGIDGFQLWSDVLPPMILRTRLTSLNRASKCGGIPGGMIGALHGPSQGGKTLLLAEILHAAWTTGGMGLFVDAECRAVDLKWFRAICGRLDEIAYFKPKTYEVCIERVEEFRRKFRILKEAGDLPSEAFCVIGIDSINRLTPSKELEEILEGKVEARGYPLRAMLNSRWLDKLVPTLQRDESFIFIQRESQKLDAMPGQKTYTVKGGRAVEYDSGWRIRITAASRVRVNDVKEGPLAGEKHEVLVEKNSMGPHLDELAYFYSATGAENGTPCGLDLAREVREEALSRELISYKKGDGYYYREEKLCGNKSDLLKWLKVTTEDGVTNYERLTEELNASAITE
jgi:RecA/RadA recombinase